jgi:hypothetical protein
MVCHDEGFPFFNFSRKEIWLAHHFVFLAAARRDVCIIFILLWQDVPAFLPVRLLLRSLILHLTCRHA